MTYPAQCSSLCHRKVAKHENTNLSVYTQRAKPEMEKHVVVVESLSLEDFKKHLDIALWHTVLWKILVTGGWLDWMILEVFSKLGDPMIL